MWFFFFHCAVQVNCILEAFGHAKTLRNSNSSRFIKLLTIQYCEKTKVMLRGDWSLSLLESMHTDLVLSSNRLYSLYFLSLDNKMHWISLKSKKPLLKRQVSPEIFRYFFISFPVLERYSKTPAGGSKSPFASLVALFFRRATSPHLTS